MELFPRSIGYLAFTVLHLLCFAFGIAVCGLYGRDISRASKHPDGYADGKWVYAVIVGAMSVVTSVVYWVPFVLRVSGVVMPVWNFVLFVLWSAVFGVFAKMYIDEDPEGDGDIKRMKDAVWVDLINMLLWLVATLAAGGYWLKHRETKSRFTGRANLY